MKNKGILIGLGIFATMLTSLGIYWKSQYKKLTSTCFLTSGMLIKEFNINRVVMTILLKISNESDVRVKLKNPKFLVYINNILVAKVGGNNDIDIKNNACSFHKLEVDFVPADVFNASLSAFQDLLLYKKKAKIKTVGIFDVNIAGIPKKDFIIETEMEIGKMLDGTAEESSPCKC